MRFEQIGYIVFVAFEVQFFTCQFGASIGTAWQDCFVAVLECCAQCSRLVLGSTQDFGQPASLDISTFHFDHLGPTFDQTLLQTTLFYFHPICIFRTGPFYASFEGATKICLRIGHPGMSDKQFECATIVCLSKGTTIMCHSVEIAC